MTKPRDYSCLTSSDITYIDSLYDDYTDNPQNLDLSWQQFFKGFEYKIEDSQSGVDLSHLRKEFNVFRLIQSFRARGHLLSDTNPIRPRKNRRARITLKDYDLEYSDYDREFFVGEFAGFGGPAKLKDIENRMRKLYCEKIGIEYMHSNNTDVRRWVRNKFEKEALNIDLPLDKKKRILHKLNAGQVFESFLQSKFIGQKRFSLEGGESTIPAIDAMVNKGGDLGVKEFAIGMAHRGRLNVLANILGKSYSYIFQEFTGGPDKEQHMGGGDVKYHKGYTSVIETPNKKKVCLKIMHNPSHLEAVSPVTLGYARAQAHLSYQNDYSKVCPVFIHGDAAVAGQGVVYETLQMAQLEAYQCGGAIHFVINNQIGFTTDFDKARSSHYCTSVARTLEAPIIHINGDEPEMVVFAMEFAMEFRQLFQTDIFVDMVCYRKHGHNEGDEPKYTQPELYGLIAKQKNPRELYIDNLTQKGAIDKEMATELRKGFNDTLSQNFQFFKQDIFPKPKKGPHTEWLNIRKSQPADFETSPPTQIEKKDLDHIIDKITLAPEGFNILRKAQKILTARKSAYQDDKIDWALAELLAYGNLLLKGVHVRFSGQDIIRGTFSQRHAKLFDEKTNQEYCGLENLSNTQGDFRIFNSHLSEYAVLGFEYGYSLATPNGLNIWEAQFGDFANTAQVVIDQFIAPGESKWNRMCDLVLLLPHGMEGQGPEHSNAHPERYLSLCADDNMVVLNCTTPAQIFHALNRQLAWPFRKPLVIFTPKSLLRDPRCVSSKKDILNGRFQETIDAINTDPQKVKKVLFCTGKIYYELLGHKLEHKRDDIAILRLEQIFPFPLKQVKSLIERYQPAEFFWVQEENANMGYWEHLLCRQFSLFKDFNLISRPAASSPAVGSPKVHEKQTQTLLKEAFKV